MKAGDVMNAIPIMYTITEAAEKYGIAAHALRNWIKRGELKSVRAGKKYLICDSVLCDFLISGSTTTPNEGMQSNAIRHLR